ncbi:hypothetical protein LTR70_001382 [Exophiala xenobiotica]|uniref:Uncharacterized protein n=1 Tax=Lithohypha guttulata TaxID=1690604 RepID=A0ABR0KNE5_9EURO|nr:hypothetical protein LTR24_000863 [Lithohypha guttulata]KAK5328061.1 hypothetical protein LTR70_001382 [Exophiala xenobiotica]
MDAQAIDKEEAESILRSDSESDQGSDTLEEAILNGDLARVRQFIQDNALVDEPIRGKLPLVLAVEQGEEDVAMLLVEAGADLTLGYLAESLVSTNPMLDLSLHTRMRIDLRLVGPFLPFLYIVMGLTHIYCVLKRCVSNYIYSAMDERIYPGDAILTAIMSNERSSEHLVMTLLLRGILPQDRIHYSRVPFQLLRWASSRGHLTTVLKLLELGVFPPRPDLHDNPFNESSASNASPVFAAATSGHADVLYVFIHLCHFPVDARFPSCNNMTVLMACIAHSSWIETDEYPFKRAKRVVEILVSLGADLNLQDDDGNTALAHAFGKNHVSIGHEVAEVLLENGANPNIADKKGRTPLHLVSWFDTDTCLLISHGADVLSQDLEGNTALHCISRTYNVSGLRAILASLDSAEDPRLDVMNNKGETALQILAESAYADALQIFVDYAKARNCLLDINAHHNNTATPLERACERGAGTLDVVKVLLQCGADPNLSTHAEGKTPLHAICPDHCFRLFSRPRRGQGVMIIGGPGSGKSTLANSLAGLWGMKNLVNRSSAAHFDVKPLQPHKDEHIDRRFEQLIWSKQVPTELAELATVVSIFLCHGASVDPVWRMTGLDNHDVLSITPLGIAASAIPPSVPLLEAFLKAGADVYGMSPAGRSAFFEVCAAQGWINKGVEYLPFLVEDLKERTKVLTVEWGDIDVGFPDEHLYTECPIYRLMKRTGTKDQMLKYLEQRRAMTESENQEGSHQRKVQFQARQEMVQAYLDEQDLRSDIDNSIVNINDEPPDATALFLSYGASVAQIDALGLTALHHAAANSNFLAAHHLLKKGASLEAIDARGYTPLLYACSNRHWLRTSEWRDWKIASCPNTPTYVAWHGSLASDFLLMELLGWRGEVRRRHHTLSYYLDWKADMSVRDAAGNTALHLATQTGNPCIVAFLLRRCGDQFFKLVNELGRSALHYATSSVEVAELLLDYEAYSDIADDKKYFTFLPMDYAGPAARSPYGTRQGMLNVQDSAGNTALHYVAMEKRADIFLLYLRNKHVNVDIDVKNVEGMTAKEILKKGREFWDQVKTEFKAFL